MKNDCINTHCIYREEDGSCETDINYCKEYVPPSFLEILKKHSDLLMKGLAAGLKTSEEFQKLDENATKLERLSGYSLDNLIEMFAAGWTIVSEISGAIDGVVQYVITESVGQYTGLKDKNGKKIFEGDLLSINGSKEENTICPEVVFSDFQWICVIRNDERFKYYRHRLEDNPNKYEVIGNIHDNPEMISRKGD